jgi:hypothetical protein
MDKIVKQFFLGITFLTFVVSAQAQRNVSNSNPVCSDSVIAQSLESTDIKEVEYRKSKNAQYNSKGDDLTTRNPNFEYFVETFIPRGLPLIPVEESSVVVVGKVVKIQPYLSEDKSQIYTEITVQVQSLLKNDDSQSEIKTIILDKLGGAVRLNSGRIIQYEVQINGRGNPCKDNRYIFFIQKTDKNKGYYFIKGYELSEGKVFTLDNSNKKLISEKYKISESFSDEKNFLELTRCEIEKNNKVK